MNMVAWMYKIDFYRKENGTCDIEEFLNDLQKRAANNKDARIQHKQVAQHIQFLADHGTRVGEPVTKYLGEDIWELRPGNNRILFFFFIDNTFVLLHHFRKKTQKTPIREIERAKAERDDWISRKG